MAGGERVRPERPADNRPHNNFALNELERPKTSQDSSPDRTAAKPQDRPQEPERKPDNNKPAEIIRDQNKVPETPRERQDAIRQNREAAATTGTARDRTITTSTGEQIKGTDHFDKKTREHTFIGANKDGTFTQYKVDGKTYQPLDGSGKPAGAAIEVGKPAAAAPERQQFKDGRDRAAEIAEVNANGRQREFGPGRGRDGEGFRPESKKDKTPEGGKPELGTKPADGGIKPGDGGPKPADAGPKSNDGGSKPNDGAAKPNDGGGNKQVFTPAEQPHNPHRDNPYQQPRPERPDRPERPQGPNPNPENPQGYRPHQDFNRDKNDGGGKDWRGSKNDGDGWRPGKDGDRPGGNKDGQDRPQVNNNPKSEERPQGHRPDFNQNNRPDYSQNNRPDQQQWQRPGRDPVARPELAPQRPEIAQVRPELRPDMHGRPEGPRADYIGRFDQTSRPDMMGRQPGQRELQEAAKMDLANGHLRNIDRAMMADLGRDLGRSRGGDFQGPRDFTALKNMDAAGLKQFLDGQRGPLRGEISQNLRLPGDQIGTAALGRGLAQTSEISAGKPGLRAGLEGDRFNVNLTRSVEQTRFDARDLNGKQILNPAAMAETAGKTMVARLMDLMTKHEMDKVPTADQSRLIVRELMNNNNNKMDQANHQDLSLTRTLNQRNLDNAQQQTFTAKGLQLDNAQQLSLRTKDQTEQVKDANKANEAATRNLDNNRPQTNQNTQNISNRSLDAANSAQTTQQKAEQQVRTHREAEEHNVQVNKPQQQVFVQPDRVQTAENKADANQIKANTDSKQNDDKRLDEEQRRTRKEQEEKETKQEKAEQMAAFLAAKLKDQKEKEKEKEKENTKDKSKQDPKQKTRLKYRVKQNDTLASIAARFCNSADHAPAIFHINRTLIPVTTHNGSTFANPPADTMIWIPTDEDLDLFKDTGVLKKYAHISFAGVKFATAEEELAAKFGRRWFGPSEEEKAISNSALSAAAFSPERAARRANIENQLGAFNPQSHSDGRIRYTVRLGETLKSIALKHPHLKDVDMWKLIAKANNLPTELDAKGCPIAIIKRGMILVFPSYEEVENFRASKKNRTSASHMLPTMPSMSIEAIR